MEKQKSSQFVDFIDVGHCPLASNKVHAFFYLFEYSLNKIVQPNKIK